MLVMQHIPKLWGNYNSARKVYKKYNFSNSKKSEDSKIHYKEHNIWIQALGQGRHQAHILQFWVEKRLWESYKK